MTKVKNSLSTFLEQAVVLNNNSLETIDKISDAVSTSEETVKLTLTDPNDTQKTVEYLIPSFGHLQAEINRLSATLDTVTNITNGSGSRIRLSDGSYRKIIASKVPSEAPSITSVDHITNFNFKSNWFFEDMLNPCLYITWDMSNQISPDTERVKIQRYILTCDTQTKKDLFNSKLNGRNDIDYREFLKFILNNKIKYTLDDEVKDLPPRSRRYYGTFSVIRIDTEKDLNGNNVKRYVLDSLEFTDSRSGFENTRILSVGDFVEVNSNPVTTRFEVIYSSPAENKIGLKCIEGCEGVRVGAATLKISSSQDTLVSADIPVGFDEREVIFVKAIDPDSNIPSTRWSPGVAFYSNELTYQDGNGVTQTLKNFYQKNVVDFGQVFLSYAYDYYPSIREGIKPDAPVLNYGAGEGDFKIVQINNQLTETTDAASFRSLISDKIRVQSELDNISSEIAKQKELIQTTQYVSTNEKLKAQETLDTLIGNQETLNANYASIVNNIKSKYESGITAEPKYRVRGFWDIPNPKVSASSGEQEIIKFKIRYRYLSESGNANKEEEFSYRSGNSIITGRFSNWNEIETKLRPRVLGADGWEWEKMDTADPDSVNINQLDIPINPGEQVEIRVKSISEAGWPANPLESDWSDAITIAFSDFAELQADSVRELVEQNKVDAAVANVTKLFSGQSAHMASSFYTNDKYFAHTAENITSGFLTPEQTPITLYDKLQELQSQITMVIEQISGSIGELNVVLVDNSDESKIYTLEEGGTTYINAGNYADEISGLDKDKKNGHIVTKTYYVDISTDTQSGLFLLSKLAGNRYSMCPNTITDESGRLITGVPEDSDYDGNDYDYYDNIVTPSTSSSTYYMEQGRYDLVPINLTNPELLDFQLGSPSMYQSAQCRGQFVYSRFRNIGDTFDMYANTLENGKAIFKYDAPFLDGEAYSGGDNIPNFDNEKYYNEINGETCDEIDMLINEYNYITGSEIEDIDRTNSNSKNDICMILNRLPRTWEKTDTSTIRLINNLKISRRNLDFSVDNTSRTVVRRTSSSPTSRGTSSSSSSGASRTTSSYKVSFTPEEPTINDSSITIKCINATTNEPVTEKTIIIGGSINKSGTLDNNGEYIIDGPFAAGVCPITLQIIGGSRQVKYNIANLTIKDPSAQSNPTDKNATRVSNLMNYSRSTYTVIPKIQTTYGFADMGKLLGIDLDGSQGTLDDGSYLTTHKIGYEDKDRYANGAKSCNSYLFLSPVNHNEIQVDGDTANSSRVINAGSSLRVPIIFQYRMLDYSGAIFGDSANKATDLSVKNAKFANIIGLDIWTDRNSLRPKQYDIIVYSTFGNVIETNTAKTKTSTQTLVNAGKDVAVNINKLVQSNKSIATKTPLLELLTKPLTKLFK